MERYCGGIERRASSFGRDRALHDAERVVQWPLVLVVLFGLLAAGIAYALVLSIAAPRTSRADVYAVASAVVVALLAGIVLTRVPRPWVVAANTPVDRGHPFSCSRALTAARDVAHGSVDAMQTQPNGVVMAPGEEIERVAILVVRGWATDAAIRHPLAGVCLLNDGKPMLHQAVSYGETRTDVAQVFKQDAVVNTGFEIRAAAAELAPGRHVFEVVGVDERGRESPIAPPLRLTVR